MRSWCSPHEEDHHRPQTHREVWHQARPTTGSPTAPRSDEPTKRLTIDISLSLHQRVKSQCALNGENMADVVRELLEKRFKPERPAVVQSSEPVVTASEPVTEMQKDDSVTIRNYDSDHTGA